VIESNEERHISLYPFLPFGIGEMCYLKAKICEL